MVLPALAVPAIIGAVGSVAGAGIGLLGSKNSSTANTMSMQDAYNLEMYNTMKDLYMMNVQNQYNERNLGLQAQYNAQSEARQYDYQTKLANLQFDQNKWFVQNAYQNTVQDLYKAGLNPLLAVQNGSNVGNVGMGSAAALSAGLPSSSISSGSGVDPASMMSASANSANAKIAKSQFAVSLMNAMSDLGVKLSSSAKMSEEANTLKTQQDLNRYETLNKAIDTQLKNVELHFKSDKEKSEIYKNIYSTKAMLLQAEVADYLKESQAYSNYTSANANMINATTGNPTKVLVDLIKGITGDDVEKGGNKVYNSIKGKVQNSYDNITTKPSKENNYHMNDYDMKILKSLYDALELDKKGVKF